MLAYIALGIAQLAAFFAGMELWLGLGWIMSFLIFVVVASLPLGSLATAAVAFYGAYKGWHWEWWQAALLAFPFAIIGIIMMTISGAAGLVGLLSSNRA
jgi:hypothetical protein